MNFETLGFLCLLLFSEINEVTLILSFGFYCLYKALKRLVLDKYEKRKERINSISEAKYEGIEKDIELISTLLKDYLYAPPHKLKHQVKLKKDLKKLRLSNNILKFKEDDKFRKCYLKTLDEIEDNNIIIDEKYIMDTVTNLNQELEIWYIKH